MNAYLNPRFGGGLGVRMKIRAKLLLGVTISLILIVALIFYVIYLKNNYRPNEFSSDFALSIIASLIGVLIGALLAIIIGIFVVNPYVKYREEQRFKPLRGPLLVFWDHTLTLYTLSVLSGLKCPKEVAPIISDAFGELTLKVDSRAEKKKLVEIKKWLSKFDREEISLPHSTNTFEESLKELKDFIDRMHTTLVALPYLFKETPEIAVGIEILLGNLLSGLQMIEYKHETEGKLVITKLDFYSTAIIKNTAHDALLLVGQIREFLDKD